VAPSSFSASNAIDVLGSQVITGGLSIGPYFSTQGLEATWGLKISSAPIDKGLSTFTNANSGAYSSGLLIVANTVSLTPPTTSPTSLGLTISEMNVATIGALTLSSSVASTVITSSAGLQISPPLTSSSNVSITNLYGIKINTQGTNNTTNAYGLHVSAPTGAANNYALYTQGVTLPWNGFTVASATLAYSGTGPYVVTLTNMSSTAGLTVGNAITAVDGTGKLFSGTLTSAKIASIISATSITVDVVATGSPTAGDLGTITSTGVTTIYANASTGVPVYKLGIGGAETAFSSGGGGGGTTTNALTIGTGLLGTASTFNGSAANTISIKYDNANTWTALQTFTAGLKLSSMATAPSAPSSGANIYVRNNTVYYQLANANELPVASTAVANTWTASQTFSAGSSFTNPTYGLTDSTAQFDAYSSTPATFNSTFTNEWKNWTSWLHTISTQANRALVVGIRSNNLPISRVYVQSNTQSSLPATNRLSGTINSTQGGSIIPQFTNSATVFAVIHFAGGAFAIGSSVVISGSGYYNGTYSVTSSTSMYVFCDYGGGIGLTFDFSGSSASTLSTMTVAINSAGSRYKQGDIVSVVQGSTSGGRITINTVDANGSVLTWAVSTASSGYSNSTNNTNVPTILYSSGSMTFPVESGASGSISGYENPNPKFDLTRIVNETTSAGCHTAWTIASPPSGSISITAQQPRFAISDWPGLDSVSGGATSDAYAVSYYNVNQSDPASAVLFSNGATSAAGTLVMQLPKISSKRNSQMFVHAGVNAPSTGDTLSAWFSGSSNKIYTEQVSGSISSTAASSTITNVSSITSFDVGMKLVAYSGTGSFGTAPTITSIDTVSKTISFTSSTVNTVGNIIFSAAIDITYYSKVSCSNGAATSSSAFRFKGAEGLLSTTLSFANLSGVVIAGVSVIMINPYLNAPRSFMMHYSDSIVPDDISGQFNGLSSVFSLNKNQKLLYNITDSRDAEVIVSGKRLTPYIKEIRYPWISEYDGYRGFRIKNGNLILFYPPKPGEQAMITIRTISPSETTRQYPYSASTIALGE